MSPSQNQERIREESDRGSEHSGSSQSPETDQSPSTGQEQEAEPEEIEAEEEESDGQEDRDEYLVVVDYEEDNERKRVEYLLNNRDDITVETLRGLVRKVSVDDIDDLHEDLIKKVDDREHLSTYQLDPVSSEPDEITDEYKTTTEVDRQRIEWAFDTIIDKRSAAIEGRPQDNQYVVNTKKGTARFTYEIHSRDGGSHDVTVDTWGYGEAPRVLREFIESELEHAI